MKIKCQECGAMVRDDESACPRCGKVLYESVFSDISAELERDMARVTENDVRLVGEQVKDDIPKLTYEEFEKRYVAEHKLAVPPKYVFTRSAIARRLTYDANIKAAYNEYLRGLGYDI